MQYIQNVSPKMATSGSNKLQSRRRLSRIRCAQECIKCFKLNKTLPDDICYVPLEYEYKATKNTILTLYENPSKQSKKLKEVICGEDHVVVTSGDDICNNQGQWAKILKVYRQVDGKTEVLETPDDNSWLLLYSNQIAGEDSHILVPKKCESTSKRIIQNTLPTINNWEDVVENAYSLQLNSKRLKAVPVHQEARDKLKFLPPNWTIEHDEDLAQFLCAHTERDNDNLGSIKNYVESVDVSSFSEDEGPDFLTDGDADTYWESDGHQGQHWIRLKMKKGTVIKKLIVTIDGNDDNYMPYRFLVMGGTMENLKKLNEQTIDLSTYGVTDISILEDQKEHLPVIEIRIKECKDDGIDTRIHGIKIKSIREKDLGLNWDLFSTKNLVRFPKLENTEIEILYYRGLILQRFLTLLDSVLPYLVPAWEYSIGSYNSLEVVRQLLPMSKKRVALIETFLRESETGRPNRMPKLYINRRIAAEHKSDPGLDPECKNSIFNQMYEGLKPRDRFEKELDYRWPSRYDQWWECKFLSEGIIDQGGGFRDSLSDMADELCPCDHDAIVPLPFFIRAPNQNSVDANVNKDVYVPNPECKEFTKYEWLGKVMGACLRGKENLVLALPSFIWKKLAGEPVTWSKDFTTVDESEVRLIENMETMDKDSFVIYFGERTWSTLLSGNQIVPLKNDGSNIPVTFEDRFEYSKAVQEIRMSESNKQVDAIRKGLLLVVPQAVLDLLTWQELEKKICGDPEISIESLRRTTHYEDLEEDDVRVKNLWEALNKFSMEDRSRFLRFVTGRRRLPAPLFICPDKGDCVDVLPESSTCSNTLYLPNYSSAKMCEEKIRYAAYNCVAIDTDMSPWDE